jgi:hypothetical protein
LINELFMCVRGGHRAARAAMDATEGGPWHQLGNQSVRGLGPAGLAARAEHGALLAKHLDDGALECLAAALGAPGADPIQADDEEGDEALYSEVSPQLLEALATTDDAELRRVSERWMDLWIVELGTIPAYRGVSPVAARPTLDGEWGWWPALQRFAVLARAARQRGWSVYLWSAS